jgi:hypothetical protein
MPKKFENYVTGEDGEDRHPAFAIASVHRIHSTPGAVLFQSDVRHDTYIEITLSEATRKRNLKHDWIHPGQVLVKFSMSLAQFASFVSSTDTEGVPVTISYDHGSRPGLTLESRLALTSGEVQAAARTAFDDIKNAEAAYEAALNSKAPAAEQKQALARLRAAVANAVPNVDYASRQLAEHAEAVVEKSRADIEAMVSAARDGRAAMTGGNLADTIEIEPKKEA